MKKTKIGMALLITGLALSFNSSAQGIYFGVGGGYGFAAGKQDFPTGADMTATTSGAPAITTTTYTARSYSLGKGINMGLYGGFMFNKNVGAELGIAYLIGGSSVGTSNQSASATGFSSSDVTTTTVKGSMLRLVPGIRIQAGEGKMHPYATAGLIIGVAGKATMEQNEVKSATGSPTNTTDMVMTYTGGMAMGMHASLGMNYMVSGKLGIFGEISANIQNGSPSKSMVTTNTVNGTDQIPKMTTSQIETDYSSSYTTTSNAAVSTGTPSQASSQHTPFSSIGFNIGVHISLGGK
jgi:hypothetical protein